MPDSLQPSSYYPLGVPMDEMIRQNTAPRGVPQMGGIFGDTGQQAVNAIYPMLQTMMRQQMMQQGLMPMFPGGGSAMHQMQRFQFQDTLNESMKLAYAQDLPMMAARADKLLKGSGDFLTGIGSIPGVSGFLMPHLSKFLAPEGTRGDLTRGIVAASRGSMGETGVNALSTMLFNALSTGEKDDRRFDVSKTGGLGARQVGELMFEMQNRGFNNVFNDETLATIGGKGGLAGGQAAVVKTKLGQLGDVLGMMDEMLGGNAPMSRILNALESLSGKNIMASGANVNQIKQQITQMGAMADVLGVAPQAMMAMAQGTAMNLQASGMSRGLAIPMTTHQMSMTAAGQLAQGFTGLSDMPGSDQTGADFSKAAGILTARGVQSSVGRMLGALSHINRQGGGGAKLKEFFGRTSAEQAEILMGPGRAELLANTGADPNILRGILSDPRAGRFLQGDDLGTIMAAQGISFKKDLQGRLRRARFTEEQVSGVMGNIESGTTLGLNQRLMLTSVGSGMQDRTGIDSVVLAGMLGGKGQKLFSAVAKRAKAASIRGEKLQDMMNKMPQGAAEAMVGAKTFEEFLGAAVGVTGANVGELRKMAMAAKEAGDSTPMKAITKFEEAMDNVKKTTAYGSDERETASLKATAALSRGFPSVGLTDLANKANLSDKAKEGYRRTFEQMGVNISDDSGRPNPQVASGRAIGTGIVASLAKMISKLELTILIPDLNVRTKATVNMGGKGIGTTILNAIGSLWKGS